MVERQNEQQYNIRKAVCGLMAACILLFCVIGIQSDAMADTGVVFSAVEDSIYATLRAEGYTHAGACGILGNIAVENPTFTADLEANNGATYGLFQWNDVGDRRSNLVRWCNNRLLYPNRTEGQIAFALHELQGGDSYASRLDDFLRQTKDPQLAAMEFAVGFERCIGATQTEDLDGDYEGALYPEHEGDTYQALAKRMEKAQTYADGYRNVDLDSLQTLDITGTPTAGIVAEAEDSMDAGIAQAIGLDAALATGGRIWAYRILGLLVGYLFGNIFFVSNFKSMNSVFTHFGRFNRAKVLHTGAVILTDMAKAWIAFFVVAALTGGAMGKDLPLWTGLGVILGNDYPFWNHFRGGIGSTVTFVTLMTFMPLWGPICCVTGAGIAFITGSLPLGTAAIAMLMLPFAFFLRGAEQAAMVGIISFLIIYKLRRYLISYADKRLVNRRAIKRSSAR